MAPNPRPISLRPPPELLADIDASVPASPQANRSAWIIEACRQRLRIEAKLREPYRGAPLATQEWQPGIEMSPADPSRPISVQERAERGDPDAVARMEIAAELEAGLDPDGDIEGADYPPQPVPPCAGAAIAVEVQPVAGGAMWRWTVDHPDLDGHPVAGSESLYSNIGGNARRLLAARVGHSNFTLTMPRRSQPR